MARITSEQLRSLALHAAPATVSIYMPTQKGGNQTRQNPIRLKNLIRQAQEQLVDLGMREPQAREYLSAATALLDDSEFWRNQDEGLAVLLAGGQTRILKLPKPVGQVVTVAQRFHLKPLLSMLDEQGEFYILALSQNLVRLIRGNHESCQVVPLGGAPRSLADLMRYVDAEGQAQYYTQVSSQGYRRRTPMFHGHGIGNDEAAEKRRLLEYCHLVSAAVSRHLAGKQAPLVLAGTEPLVSLYRQASEYSHIWPRVLAGNSDRLDPAQLHAQARALFEAVHDDSCREAVAGYYQAAGGGLASSDLKEILAAADDQKVAALFVSDNDHQWGRYDPVSRRAEVHRTRQAGDQDLLDLAAVMAYRSGSGIYVLQRDKMPENSAVAATFRFAT